jgi:gliding motility-associated-like protein
MRGFYKLLSFSLLFVGSLLCNTSLIAQTDCSCTNCPVPIFDEMTHQGFLDVLVDGPNDLGQCRLEQVCFTITHTWIGDLSVTLTSPSGLNYLVMADLNNSIGGCGNPSDNINICITLGTDNPLTNNTEYVCNGPAFACLNGNWTVPCGGVTDPFSGAVQAPNCDLNDFNVPGSPANGTWILTVNDICMFNTGFLVDWSMVFECGVVACLNCEADGGTLPDDNLSACEGDSSLLLSLVPEYPGAAPDPAEYGYTFLVVQNGQVVDVDTTPSLIDAPPGTYQICGLSYLLIFADSLPGLVGLDYADLLISLPICGDLSDSCLDVSVFEIPTPTMIDTILCDGDCLTLPDGSLCCDEGLCEYVLPSVNGCDSLVQVQISILLPYVTLLEETVCEGGCVSVDGVEYCAPGPHTIILTAANGCDSIIELSFIELFVNAVIQEADTLTCFEQQITLDGSGSMGTIFTWFDEAGNQAGTDPTLLIGVGGCYVLEVSDTLNGVNCSLLDTACVIDLIALPDNPVFIDPDDTLCPGTVATYTVQSDTSATNFVWTIPANANLLDGGNGQDFATLNWTVPGLNDLCVSAENACGFSDEVCLEVLIFTLPTASAISGPDSVCVGGVVTYCVPPNVNITNYVWTVTGGASILSGQGTQCVQVDWGLVVDGTVCVTGTNPCGSSSPFCLSVTTVDAPAPPLLIGADSVCLGGIVNYILQTDINTSDYLWDIPAGMTVVGGGDGFPFVTASITGLVTEPICATAISSCGLSGQVCTDLFVLPLPLPPFIQGSEEACPGEEVTFCAPVDPLAASYTWDIPAGATLVGGQGTNCLTLLWDAPGTDTICVVATNDCGNTNPQCFTVTINPLPEPISIQGTTQFCAGDSAQYVLLGGANATDFNWIVPPCASFLSSGNGMDTLQVLWSTACGLETLEAIASNACGSVSGSFALDVLAFPQPNAGTDGSTCGLNGELTAVPSIGTGFWTLGDGPVTAVLSSPDQPQTTVNVTELGIYSFIWTEDNLGCASSDTVVLEFVMPLAIVNSLINEFCNLASGTYFISFAIEGGQPPYQVIGSIGGILDGNVFTSDLMPGDVPYLFSISDGGFCEPLDLLGSVDCQCTTLAGTMGSDLVEVCADEILIIPFTFDGNLNPEDVLQFVLHDYDGPDSLGFIFAISNTPEFSLVPPMLPGVTYYVAAVAGDSLPNGNVNFDDICLSISQGTPVLFRPLPEAGLPGGNGVICEGDSFPIVLELIGEGPFEVFFDGQLFANLQNGDTLWVSPVSTSAYELNSVSDAFGCTVLLSNTFVVVTVNQPVSAQVQVSASACNTNGPGDITVLNFNTLIQGGDASGTWADLDGSGAAGTLPVLNFFNTVPGVYTFAYTTGSAQAPCQNETYLVEVTVENCSCPGIGLNQDPEACNIQSSFDLNSLLQTPTAGVWSLLNAPAAPNAATINGSQLQTGNAAPGTYMLSFVLADPPPPGCPDSSEVMLELFPRAQAGTTLGSLEFCETEATTVVLNLQVQGAQPGGVWTEISVQASTGNAFNPATPSFNPSGQAPGTYRFRYTVSGTGPCPDDTEDVLVIIRANPTADAGPDQELTCTEPEVTLGGASTSSGNFIVYDWSASSAPVSNPAIIAPNTQIPGVYILTVTNNSTGCSASDTTLILAAQDIPQPRFEVADVVCFNDGDGLISVDDITGGTPPYLISFNGGALGTTAVFDSLSGGVYTVVLEDANGCSSEWEVEVLEPAQASIDISALNGSTDIVLGESVELHASVTLGGGAQIATTTWLSSVTGLLNCPNCLIVRDTPFVNTVYVFTVIDDRGCLALAEIRINVDVDREPFVPNIFSPNGDGSNDLFTIYAGPEVVGINYLRIFSRWGETVFERFNFPPNQDNLGWDGSHRGRPLNPGVFVWMAELELIDGRKVLYTGDVTLVR